MNAIRQENAQAKRIRKAARDEGFSRYAYEQLHAKPQSKRIACQSCETPYFESEKKLIEVPVDNGTIRLCPDCKERWDEQEEIEAA